MKNQIIVQVYTLGGGTFIPAVIDMVEGWEEKVRDHINAKKESLACTHAVMMIEGTDKKRTIDI